MTFPFPPDQTIGALFDEALVDQFGEEMFALCQDLWPLDRSLTGAGNRETLEILKREVPSLVIREVPSGTQAFDWEVPLEWTIREAWIRTPSGEKICDFSENNLNLVGYSIGVNQTISLQDLQKHLYSLPDQPDAIPYVTSYYKQHWGFCLSEKDRQKLEPGTYEVFIDSEHIQGSMTYGEILVPGLSDTEILLSTYICHPSMANNELSGIAVATQIAKWLTQLKGLQHSYRILFLPETIGVIDYLSKNLQVLQQKVIAGYVITCVGDDNAYSYVPSRRGNTLSDEVACRVLKELDPLFKKYTWADRQSDERQYCAPGVDLPVASIMRTKYGAYPEYHTSLDRLHTVVTAKGLAGGLLAYLRAIQILELDQLILATNLCEPQLGKRGLYPNLSRVGVYSDTKLMRDILSYADGTMKISEIASTADVRFREAFETCLILAKHDLLSFVGRGSAQRGKD